LVRDGWVRRSSNLSLRRALDGQQIFQGIGQRLVGQSFGRGRRGGGERRRRRQMMRMRRRRGRGRKRIGVGVRRVVGIRLPSSRGRERGSRRRGERERRRGRERHH